MRACTSPRRTSRSTPPSADRAPKRFCDAAHPERRRSRRACHRSSARASGRSGPDAAGRARSGSSMFSRVTRCTPGVDALAARSARRGGRPASPPRARPSSPGPARPARRSCPSGRPSRASGCCRSRRSLTVPARGWRPRGPEHPEGRGLVRREDAVERPGSGQQVLAVAVGASPSSRRRTGSYGDDLHVGEAFASSSRNRLALRSCWPSLPRSAAGRRCPCRRAAGPGRRAPAARLVVVGRDEADVVVAVERRVDDRRPGSPRASPRVTGGTSAVSSRGASTIPATPRLRKSSTTFIWAARSSSRIGPLPDDSHAELGAGLVRARVNGLPVLVRRALGDDGDDARLRGSGRALVSVMRVVGAAGRRAEGERQREEPRRESSCACSYHGDAAGYTPPPRRLPRRAWVGAPSAPGTPRHCVAGDVGTRAGPVSTPPSGRSVDGDRCLRPSVAVRR